jgi:hypothetical protein
LVLAVAAPAADAARAPGVPDWALGMLTIRDLGRTLEKAGKFADGAAPNSGELVKQFLMAGLVNLPAGAGIKNDGPVTMFLIDPAQDERAFILPVANVAQLKEALTDVYGVPVEKNGILTFTLPQPVPQPDKPLLIKFLNDKLLAAPNGPRLTDLEDFAAAEARRPATADKQPDAALVLKIAALRQRYAEPLLANAAALAGIMARDPQQIEKTKAELTDILEALAEVDTLELRVDLDDTGARGALELRVVPRQGTTLADLLTAPAAATDGKLLKLLPPDAAIVSAWNMNGAQWVNGVRQEIEAQGALGPRGLGFAGAILGTLEVAPDEGALAVWGDATVGGGAMLALRTSDAGAAGARVADVFGKLTALAEAAAATNAAAPGLKGLEAVERDGAKVIRMELTGARLPRGLAKLLGSPLPIQYTLAGDTLAVALGAQGPDAITRAVDTTKANAATAAKPKVELPKDSFAVALIHPVRMAQLFLALSPAAANANPAAVTVGLSDDPVILSVRQSVNLIALRIEIPAASMQVAYRTIRYLQRTARAPAPAPQKEEAVKPPRPPE